MKRAFAIMMAVAMICALTACNQKKDTVSSNAATSESATSNAATNETSAEEWSPDTVPTPTPLPLSSMSEDEFDSAVQEYSQQENGWEKYLEDQGVEITDEIRADIENPDDAAATEDGDQATDSSSLSESQKTELAIAEVNKIRTQHDTYSRYLAAFNSLVSLMKNTPNYSLSDAAQSTADYESRQTQYQSVEDSMALLTADDFGAVYNSIHEAHDKLLEKSVTIPVDLENEIAWIDNDYSTMTSTTE